MDELSELRLHRISLAASSLVCALEVLRAPGPAVSEPDRVDAECVALAMMAELEEAMDLWRVTR